MSDEWWKLSDEKAYPNMALIIETKSLNLKSEKW